MSYYEPQDSHKAHDRFHQMVGDFEKQIRGFDFGAYLDEYALDIFDEFAPLYLAEDEEQEAFAEAVDLVVLDLKTRINGGAKALAVIREYDAGTTEGFITAGQAISRIHTALTPEEGK